MENNTEPHDALFKWMITTFYGDFFQHYFPQISVGPPTFLDKEFVAKYEVLKNNIESDLFLGMEAEINGVPQEIVIIIEHKSEKKNVMRRMRDYLCYAILLKGRPVWVIVIYTDDTTWRTPVPDTIPLGFNSREGLVSLGCDIIKVNDESSADLITRATLLEKLLALKANDRGCDRKALVREIYRAMDEQGNQLNEDQKALIYKFVKHYSNLPEPVRVQIEKEYDMSVVATTITEYYELTGEERGRVKGRVEGRLENLKALFEDGLLAEDVYHTRKQALEHELAELGTKSQ